MGNEEENKVWVGDDGIVFVKMAKALAEEDAYSLVRKVKEILQGLPGKAKIMIDITTNSIIRSTSFRKKIGDEIRYIAQDIGFEKAAVHGGNVVTRTIASFIIMASGVKNMKVFAKIEKALKWLSQP